jgi:hypothetical protein
MRGRLMQVKLTAARPDALVKTPGGHPLLLSVRSGAEILSDVIEESTKQTSTAAGQIAAGNAELSQRTEEQASSLEETAILDGRAQQQAKLRNGGGRTVRATCRDCRSLPDRTRPRKYRPPGSKAPHS